MKKLIFLRRSSQIFFLGAFIYVLWSTTYPLKGLLPPETFFKINPLIMILTSISERIFLTGVASSLSMIFLALILGRFFCGWMCPLGASIDIASHFNKKFIPPGDAANKKIRPVKFYILGLVSVLALIGIQAAWIFDPMVIMARFVSLNLIPTITLIFNDIFVLAIKTFKLYGPVYDLYRQLKVSLLGAKIFYFSHSGFIFLFFLSILAGSFFIKRFWCRAICPLGATYALAAKFAPLQREIEKCTRCLECKSACRMGAIKDDLGYIKGECVLCMDCIYDCPAHITRFKFKSKNSERDTPKTSDTIKNGEISRKDFLFLLFSSLFLFGFRKGQTLSGEGCVVRPPGALKEEKFLNSCLRCGNCMKVCITNGLQPVMLQCGLQGIWTPRLVPEIGYCEYNCTLCGNVCPTNAIPRLSLNEKRNTKLGTAVIDRSICLPWAKKSQCIVCQEHCPVPSKAIKLESEETGGNNLLRPYIDTYLCIGCGICQNKCPIRPQRAVKVYPADADRR